ncbi:MAG TPA: hypothetical protein VH722_05820, partial [Alphaproteobacteria bacterium]|nr:hypothetical protein [Alphaproteobacteria bacterium]
RVNSRRVTNVRVGAQVLAGAVAGAVHEAARQGTLAAPVLRTELINLVGSFLSERIPLPGIWRQET